MISEKKKIKGTQIYSFQDIINIVLDDNQAEAALDLLNSVPEYVRNKIIDVIGNPNRMQELELLANMQKEKREFQELASQNIYKDEDFTKDRLDLDMIIINIDNNSNCSDDGHKYVNKQVVAHYAGGKRYSMILKCCPVCKKLVIESEKAENIKSNMEKFNIKHLFIGE